MLPSARVTVPTSLASMPLSCGVSVATAGGQVVAQAPLQLDIGGLAVSLSKRYRVKPAPSVTIVPRVAEVAVCSALLPPSAGAGFCAPPDEAAGAGAEADEPYELPDPEVSGSQAVTSPTTATEATARAAVRLNLGMAIPPRGVSD